MKKHLTLLLLLVMTTTLSFAQNAYQDVVYLKNGSIIRGVIIEQVPNKSIKIETADKNVFVYQMDEIEKITKESSVSTNKEENNIPQNGNKDAATSNNKRKGFIGTSIGVSIPVGNFADETTGGLAKTGFQLNLVNFGYLFSDHVGIVTAWFGAANPLSVSGYDPWSYGGLMAGPLFSFPISNNAEWDIKPMIGFAATTLPDLGYGIEQAGSFAFNFGTQFRIHVGRKTSLLLSADYFSTRPKFVDYGFIQPIGTITLGFGVAYRLK